MLSAPAVVHHPTPLARFGLTPYGDPLYRIVFAPSRRSCVFGEWPDGRTEARYERRYPGVGDRWVLERWLPAAEYARCDEATWNLRFSILGPYPARGEYEQCHVFEACGPIDANLEKLIAWIEEGRKRPFSENRAALKDAYELERKGARSTQDAIVRDRMSAFLDRPFSQLSTGGRGTKTARFDRAAEALGLPVGRNKFISVPKRKGA